MQKLFPLHASILIENFSEIILDYEMTIIRLNENILVCAYDEFLLEISANSILIKSLTSERLCLHVEELNYIHLLKKEKS